LEDNGHKFFFCGGIFRVHTTIFSAISNIIEQKEQENVEYFSYMCSMITNDGRRTREIKSRIVIVKNFLFTNKLDLNLRKKLVICYN
jgi:hypothetical protein